MKFMDNKLHNEICPACKQILTTMINLPGEHCVCFLCLEISILQPDGSLKVATEEEMQKLVPRPRPTNSKVVALTRQKLDLVRFMQKIHVDAQTKNYSIAKNVKGDVFILCFTCKLASYNPNDIMDRYCGKCHKFHDG